MNSNRLSSAYAGKKVWISGHTGFKGSWLSSWLLQLGAEVHGFSLHPPTDPSLFDQLKLAQHVRHEIGDLRVQIQLRGDTVDFQEDSIDAEIRNVEHDIVFGEFVRASRAAGDGRALHRPTRRALPRQAVGAQRSIECAQRIRRHALPGLP